MVYYQAQRINFQAHFSVTHAGPRCLDADSQLHKPQVIFPLSSVNLLCSWIGPPNFYSKLLKVATEVVDFLTKLLKLDLLQPPSL